MKLVASMIVKNELQRFLPLTVTALKEFCDTVVVLDDGSTDGSYEYLEQAGVRVKPNDGPTFFEHEGAARQRLLDWTLESNPTHILAIDADEVVADGRALRAAIDYDDEQPVWTLVMEEVWKADENHLWVRIDGGWRPHPCPILYRVTPNMGTIQQKQLSCGREPEGVRKQHGRGLESGTEVLHLGWLRESERVVRYERYAVHDGGKFHASSHLKSILWTDKQVRLQPREWPAGLSLDQLASKV